MNERQMSSLSIKGNGYFRVQKKTGLLIGSVLIRVDEYYRCRLLHKAQGQVSNTIHLFLNLYGYFVALES